MVRQKRQAGVSKQGLHRKKIHRSKRSPRRPQRQLPMVVAEVTPPPRQSPELLRSPRVLVVEDEVGVGGDVAQQRVSPQHTPREAVAEALLMLAQDRPVAVVSESVVDRKVSGAPAAELSGNGSCAPSSSSRNARGSQAKRSLLFTQLESPTLSADRQCKRSLTFPTPKSPCKTATCNFEVALPNDTPHASDEVTLGEEPLPCVPNTPPRNAPLRRHASFVVKRALRRVTGGVKQSGMMAPSRLVFLSYEAVLKAGSARFQAFTGINPQQFKVLYRDILGGDEMCKHLKFKYTQKTPKKSLSKLSVHNQLFLTLIRLRKGWTLDDLAYLFGVSYRCVSVIVFNWVQLMYLEMYRLQEPLFSTRFDQPNEDKPACFRGFPKLRAIIDTTEVRSQVPGHYGQQGNMYSDYKAGCVILYLIAINVFGAITFVSKGFEGRASDRKIFLESGIREFLVPQDSILADKGFDVRDVALMDQITVIVPPKLKKKNGSLTKTEELLTRKIACARIHVERAIRRLKYWMILKRISNKLLPLVDQIVFVCAFLSNFSNPILHLPRSL